MSGFLGGGNLFVDRLDEQGASTGLIEIGNATKMAISETTELKERISKGRDTYGQTLDTAQIKKPATISIVLDDINRDNLAIALLGNQETINEGAGSVTDENVVAIEGKWAGLAKRNITAASVVVQDATDTTNYTEGTDYEIHYRLGKLKALAGGAITDGQTLHVDYDHAAVSGTRIQGSARPTVRARLFLDGKNFIGGASVQVTVDEAVLTPSSEVDFLADNYTTVQLSGSLRTLPGKSSPYTVDMLD